jgi:hypothetical protein
MAGSLVQIQAPQPIPALPLLGRAFHFAAARLISLNCWDSGRVA